MSTQRQGEDDRSRGASEQPAAWESRPDPTQGGEGGASLLGLWLATAMVAGLAVLVVAIGVVAQRLPPGALLGAWLLANGLLGLLALLSAVLPTPPRLGTERHPSSVPVGSAADQRLRL